MILIPLTQERFALVDDADADLLAFKWYAHSHRKTFYARRADTKAKLHRVIAGRIGIAGSPDHRNRCGLDNRRANLRQATSSQNQANQAIRRDNTSGFKGVSWRKQTGKWRAYISINRKLHSLGHFDDPESAARARDAAARELHGEFAVLNFP